MHADAGPTPFGEWLESQRRQVATAHPEAAALLDGLHDLAGFSALLRSPHGNKIVAALIAAKTPRVNRRWLDPGCD